MKWNVPGKYGPHGELFFFLIKEELATMPGSQTFGPFFTAVLMSSRKCALVAMH